jgi:hypothetical protein
MAMDKLPTLALVGTDIAAPTKASLICLVSSRAGTTRIIQSLWQSVRISNFRASHYSRRVGEATRDAP